MISESHELLLLSDDELELSVGGGAFRAVQLSSGSGDTQGDPTGSTGPTMPIDPIAKFPF